MALKPLNSVAGFSVGETPANIILANGDITTNNITTTGVANLNAIGNVRVSGGSNGQVIQTDGLGNLSFVTISTSSLTNGNSNIQVLANSNITFSSAGNANIVVISGTGANITGYLTVDGNITANGNISANNYIVTPATKDLIIAPATNLIRTDANVNPYSDSAYTLGNSLARWSNIYTKEANISGNANIGSVRTDNLLYANGNPWDLQQAAGANTEIQYNDGSNNFGASANFTFNYSTNILTVNGNAQFNNANLGNLATANYVNVSNQINGNIANFTGNLTALNADLGNLATANYVNVSNQINGNIANFTGNLTALNANLGNLATANYVNVSSNITTTNLVANTNVDFTSAGNVSLGPVGNIHISGGTDGYVLQTDGNGNLSWQATGSPSIIHNGNSNVTIPNPDGNVYINANAASDQQWVFDTNGFLTLASTGVITTPVGSGIDIFTGNVSYYSEIYLADSGNVTISTQGEIYNWSFDTTGNLTTPGEVVVVSNNEHGGTGYAGIMTMTNTTVGATNPNKYLRLNTTGNLQIVNSAYTQTIFDLADSGELTLYANLTAANANLGNLVTANFANFTNDLVVQGNIANANNISVTNNITSDTSNVTGNLTAGNVDGGNLVKANNFSTNGSGGDITLTGGNVQGANVVIANSFTSNGGLVDFNTNNPNVQLGFVDNVHIGGGSSGYVLSTDGSGVLTWVATGTQSEIYNQNSNVTIPTANGNVYINANAGTDRQWNFDTTGYLTTPFGGQITQSYDTGNATGQLMLANSSSGYTNGIAGLNQGGGNNTIYLTDAGIEFYSNSIGAGPEQYWHFDGAGNTAFPATGTANLGNLVTANFANFTNDLVVQGNIANANNISVTNAIAAGSANITNDLVVQGNIANANNISVTNNITAGSANVGSANVTNDLDVGGNIVTGTGSGGNISGVNYITANVANITNVVNTGAIANGTSNIRLATDSNVTISVNGSSNVFTFNDLGANVIGYIQANGIISAGGFEGSNLVSNVGILSLQAKQTGGDYNINLLAGGAGNIDVGSTYITSVANPENPQDAATKYYVDLVAQGLHVHAPANLATGNTLANILNIPSGNVVYNQPGPEGVGATLTFTGNSLTQLDGNTVTANMRLLIKNEANAVWNGVYLIGSNAFFITRTTDEDQNADFAGGDFLFVTSGTQFADTGWVQVTDNVVIGTSNIVFNQFSGAGSYYGANGILVSGTEISANVDNVTTAIIGGNIAVKDGAQLNYPNIGAATGTSLDLTGNVLAGNLNSNASVTGVDATFSGNISTTGAQGNIQGANTIFSDSFVSNGGLVDFNTNSANVQLGSNANVHLYGGSTGQVLITDGSGNISWTSTPNISIIQNGTSNVTIPTTNGNVIVDVNGNATLTVTGTGANITGTANISGNLESGNLSTTTAIITTGNITTINSGLLQNGNSNIAITSNGNITTTVASNSTMVVTGTGANITGYANITGNLTSGNADLGNLATANTITVNNTLNVGSLTQITYGNVTTTSVSANQTIASLNVVGVTGLEFLVKAIDQNGIANKYSVATVTAVTDGTDVDYAVFGTVQLGGYTGSLAVNVVGGYVRLQVTPASSNSTVWVTQARTV